MPTAQLVRIVFVILAVSAALGAPARGLAEDRIEWQPFATVSVGLGMAQDGIQLSSPLLGAVDARGLGAFGMLAGVGAGLDLRQGGLLAGARIGYQRSWLKQRIDLSVAPGESLATEGSLDESLLLLARAGWAVGSVPIYVTGGWVWSSASTAITAAGFPTVRELVHQDGGVIGIGLQPTLSGAWFVELEYLLLLYRQVQVTTILGSEVGIQVKSIATTCTASIGYHF